MRGISGGVGAIVSVVGKPCTVARTARRERRLHRRLCNPATFRICSRDQTKDPQQQGLQGVEPPTSAAPGRRSAAPAQHDAGLGRHHRLG